VGHMPVPLSSLLKLIPLGTVVSPSSPTRVRSCAALRH